VNRLPIIQVFAKYPHNGRVKTRLARVIGSEQATQIHQELVERQLAHLQHLPAYVKLELWCDEDADSPYYHTLFRRWPRLSYRRQSDGDLGARLAAALQRGVRHSRRILQIGTDCPVLGRNEIESALSGLNQNVDIVFIPAEDGGYVLGAYRQYKSGLFDHIDWSTERVLRQSLRQIASLGLTAVCLPSLWDIDHAEDLERYRQLQYTGPGKE